MPHGFIASSLARHGKFERGLETVKVQKNQRRMVNSQASALPSAQRSCAGCGGQICDRFLLFSMERYWHNRCLKCSCCHAHLGEIGSSCYSKGGMILCRSDYIR
uniref:LIM zinc-binding domain-containing protein n=1 Tax=Knipowitschia caucasica TaxID=637954 RepID=A0AAV2MU69_KNICA